MELSPTCDTRISTRHLNPVETFVGSEEQGFIGGGDRRLGPSRQFVNREFAILFFAWGNDIRLARFVEYVDSVFRE